MYSACIMFLMLVGVESRTYYKQSVIDQYGYCICDEMGFPTEMTDMNCHTWFGGVSIGEGWCGLIPPAVPYSDMAPVPPTSSDYPTGDPDSDMAPPIMAPMPSRRRLVNTEMCICDKTCQEGEYLVGNVCTSCTGVVVVGVSEDVCVTKDELKAKYNEVECSRL